MVTKEDLDQWNFRANCEGHRQILDVVDPAPMDLVQFGKHPSGPLPEAHQQVVDPETVCPLNETSRQQFLDGLDYGGTGPGA